MNTNDIKDRKKMNLPQGWIQVKMPDVVEWSSGGTPKSDNPKYYNGTIPWLIIGDLTDNVVYSSATKITELGMKESNAKYVEKDSVLLAMYGSIGKLGIAGVRLTTNQAIAFTKVFNGINNWYLFYYLQLIKSKLFSLSKGGTQKNISLTVINSLNLPLSPLPEQQRIVAKIDSLFSELENGITLLKTIKAQLAIYRQSVLKWAFEGKENFVSFGEITDSRLGKMLDTNKNKGTLELYLRNINVRWFDFNLDDLLEMKFEKDEDEKYSVKKGDLIICEGGEPGRCAIWKQDEPIKYQKALHRVRPKDDWQTEYLMYYIRYITNTGHINNFFTGTGIKHLTGESLKKIPVPICSKSEQQAIVSAIESRLSVCDKLEQTIDQTLALSASLRQSILKKAFEGRLVPQDPDDEPAEKLLERIRLEKASKGRLRKKRPGVRSRKSRCSEKWTEWL